MTIALDKNPDSLFPENLLDADPSSENGLAWRIAHVKSRREKTLADYLAARDIGYFLPLVRKRQPAAYRTRYSLLPLFPGYVFFKSDEFGRYSALRSNQIARVIEVADPARLLHELRQIKQVLSGNVPVFPAAFIKAGQRVRVRKGPLKDVEGVIVRADKGCRLVLTVSSIMQSVSVQLEADMVERV